MGVPGRVLYILIGGYLLMHPVTGLASLTIALAMYLFLEAVLEFVRDSAFGRFRDRLAPGRWDRYSNPRRDDLEDMAVEHGMGYRYAGRNQYVF